jgi:hypothetical protein
MKIDVGFCHWEGMPSDCIDGSRKAVRIFLEYEDVASATKAGGQTKPLQHFIVKLLPNRAMILQGISLRIIYIVRDEHEPAV